MASCDVLVQVKPSSATISEIHPGVCHQLHVTGGGLALLMLTELSYLSRVLAGAPGLTVSLVISNYPVG